ncbi:MAG: SPOR domain-containing protein [Gemmatimonadales bacterium]
MKPRYTILVLAILSTATTAGWSQQDERVVAAVQMAQEGNSDSARSRIQSLLASLPANDPVYPEALYAAGTIAPTAPAAQRYFRRVALEYSFSPWADDALLRLAQIRYVSHDPLGTVRAVERLRADYPASPLLPTAAYWAARASVDLNDVDAACEWVSLGLSRAGSDIETVNQLRYFSGRCGDGVSATPEPSPGGQAAPPAGPVYRVQVTAVSSRAAADEVAAGLRNLGYPVSVVEEGGLYKVRAGAYRDRPPADEAVRTIRSRMGGQPFVVIDQ